MDNRDSDPLKGVSKRAPSGERVNGNFPAARNQLPRDHSQVPFSPSHLERTDHIKNGPMESMGTAWALRIIATLPPDQAEAVTLRVVAGLDVATTARVLGKRPGSVRVATMRGLRRLAAHPEVAAIGHRWGGV